MPDSALLLDQRPVTQLCLLQRIPSLTLLPQPHPRQVSGHTAATTPIHMGGEYYMSASR